MNPRKPDSDRCRDAMVGASFPPSRVDELKALAKRRGHTVSSLIRTTLFEMMDKEKTKQAA